MQSRMDQEYKLWPRMWYVEEEMEGTPAELDSSVPQAQGQAYRLFGSPRPPDPVPPPGLAVGGGKIRAWSSPAPLTEPEGIGPSSQSWAPLGIPNAREPGRVVSASAAEDSLRCLPSAAHNAVAGIDWSGINGQSATSEAGAAS